MERMGFQLPLGPPPPLVNQLPPIFGGFMTDSLSNFDISAQMFGDGSMLDDISDPKRRRIARACDMCRKKKIKCDGKMPQCTHCLNYKTECVFTQVEKKRAPPKGAKYIEGLENRLGRMETLLRLSGLLNDQDGDEMDLGMLEKKLEDQVQRRRQASRPTSSNAASPFHGTPRHDENLGTPHSSLSPGPGRDDVKQERLSASVEPSDKPGEVEQLSEMMCSLVTNQTGDTNYTGSASAFSIFSPKGIQWVNERTGDNSFQNIISNVSIDSNKWTHWKPEVFGDLFARPIFIQLPDKAEALSLVNTYFDHLNSMVPLFHRPTFMHLFERQYSNDPLEGPGWWASLNAIFATAHRMRVMSGLVSRDEDVKSWAFIKNALGVFTELTMRSADLLGVQALLSMALFLQGTPNPQPAFILLAAAIRLSHSIGLHKRGTGFNLNPVEQEQRKRVFWIAYALDKDQCLRNGRPPAQDDDDVNVELPDSEPEDGIGNIPLADDKGKLNLFRTVSEFAVIESKVYKRLYASKATKQSDGELLQTIGELDQELEDWKDRIPIEFRPEHEIKAAHTPLMLHVVMLHFCYYNCLTAVHRMSVHHGHWTSRLSNYAISGLNARPLNPRVFSSAALCTAAARASISLLKYVPPNDTSCVWMVLYFPVSALVTLFGHILQNPLDTRAQSDIKLMGVVIAFLNSLGQEAETGGVQRMLGVCVEFERVARVFVEKAETEQHSRRKRKNHDTAPAAPRMPPPAVTTPSQQPPQQTVPSPPQQHSAYAAVTPPQTSGHASAGASYGVYQSPTGPQLTPTSMVASRPPPQSMNHVVSQQLPHHLPQQQQQQQQHYQHPQQPSSQQYHHPQGPSAYNPPYQLHQSHPPLQPHHVPHPYAPAPAPVHHQPQPPPPPVTQWPSVQDFNMPGQPDYMSFADLTGFGAKGSQSPQTDWDVEVPFQGQVLLPQDLTTLPMSLDWDWAEMSGGAYPSVMNGNYANMR